MKVEVAAERGGEAHLKALEGRGRWNVEGWRLGGGAEVDDRKGLRLGGPTGGVEAMVQCAPSLHQL